LSDDRDESIGGEAPCVHHRFGVFEPCLREGGDLNRLASRGGGGKPVDAGLADDEQVVPLTGNKLGEKKSLI
jgi:hypothetical protein